MRLRYNNEVIFFNDEFSGYANNKTLVEEATVNCIFLQNINFIHGDNQDAITSDAVCYPDPSNDYVLNNYNRLEGKYLLANIYGDDDDECWFKVTHCRVNRDHLLGNDIKNIELLLKKTVKLERPIGS